MEVTDAKLALTSPRRAFRRFMGALCWNTCGRTVSGARSVSSRVV